jgi:hypothetical protein
MSCSSKITAVHLQGLPGLSEKARDQLLALQPKTVLEALRIPGIGRGTTRKLLELGLLIDPEGVQYGARQEPPQFVEMQPQQFGEFGIWDLLGIKSLTRVIPPSGTAYLYAKPVNMQWGPAKLSKLCTEQMGINPATGAVFIFFNKAMDKLKVFFVDDEGSQEFMKILPKGGFMVPVAEEGKRYVKISGKTVHTLFR